MRLKRVLAACAAAIMILGTLSGCGNSASTGGSASSAGQTAEGETVNLKWVIIGNGMPSNYDTWIAKVNEYIGEKVGVNLEMEVIPWGDWDKRRNIIVSTNEPYDIIFGTGNNYIADISLGAYYDITDMISDNMPGLTELMPEKYWDGVKVQGRIYGIPTYKDSSISNYAVWDKELVDEYSLDIASLTEIESLTETFEMLKAEKNLKYWGCHRLVMGTIKGDSSAWQSTKIGAGSVPIETDEGWLLIYHGVINTCNGFVYRMGCALLDLEEPWKVKKRTKNYILGPHELYECVGDVPNVVFPCAALTDAATGRIAIYYGCADTVTGLAFTTADRLMAYME